MISVEITPRFLIDFTFGIGASTFALGVGLLVTILIYRALHEQTVAHRRRITERWAELFAAFASDSAPPVPPLSRRDRQTVLQLYVRYRRSFRGPAADGMDALARAAELDAFARTEIASRRLDRKILGVLAAGYLRDKESWKALLKISRGEHSVLSLAAVQALFQLDAEQAIRETLPMIAEREEWPENRLASILRQCDRSGFLPLVERVKDLSRPVNPRVLGLLSFAPKEEALPAVRGFLGAVSEPERINAALRFLERHGDAQDRPRILPFLDHPEWTVRLNASTAYGRLGAAEDFDVIGKRLGDKEWWVRYRAAQALCRLPGVARTRVESLADGHPDRYARDILRHVLSEQGAAR